MRACAVGRTRVPLSSHRSLRPVLTPCWDELSQQERYAASAVVRADVPDQPGVYVWYLDAEPIYVGKAASLLKRVWGKHLALGPSMRSSSFRRNVANHLGISTPNAIYSGGYQPTAAELHAVRAFIERCHVTWLVLVSEQEAVSREHALLAEWRPPFNRG